jgi:hypothetical protein
MGFIVHSSLTMMRCPPPIVLSVGRILIVVIEIDTSPTKPRLDGSLPNYFTRSQSQLGLINNVKPKLQTT